MRYFLVSFLSFHLFGFGLEGSAITVSKDNLSREDTVAVYRKYLRKSFHKTKKFNRECQRNNKIYCKRLLKHEEKIKKKLCEKNPGLGDYLFKASRQSPLYQYASGQAQRGNKEGVLASTKLEKVKVQSTYFAFFDTLKNSVKYLSLIPTPSTKERGVKNLKRRLVKAEKEIAIAEKNIKEAEQISAYTRKRKIILQNALGKYPELDNDLLDFKKDAYYYKASFHEAKQLFKNPSSIENEATTLLKGMPEYRGFMKENSVLSNIFKTPLPPSSQVGEGISSTAALPSVDGKGVASALQTNKLVEEMMQNSLKDLGSDAKNIVETNMGKMHSTLSKAKNEFSFLDNLADVPDFKVNPLKAKRFADRVKYGMNLQFTPGTLFVPVAGEIGFNAGYQFALKATVGITSFYRAGFGDGLRRFEWSKQGWSYGVYAEHKLRRIFYLYGTWERDYYADVSYRSESLNKSAWKNCAMLGLKLKVETKKKHAYCMTLLYDFMHETTVPFTPALVYRMGWEF